MQHSELSVQRQKNTTENPFVFPLLLRRERCHYTAAHSLVTVGFYFPVGSRGFLWLLVAVALQSPLVQTPAQRPLGRVSSGQAQEVLQDQYCLLHGRLLLVSLCVFVLIQLFLGQQLYFPPLSK